MENETLAAGLDGERLGCEIDRRNLAIEGVELGGRSRLRGSEAICEQAEEDGCENYPGEHPSSFEKRGSSKQVGSQRSDVRDKYLLIFRRLAR
jgi:hypothetical protein